MIVYYSDTSFTNLRNASSKGGYIMYLHKDEKKYAPISWKRFREL